MGRSPVQGILPDVQEQYSSTQQTGHPGPHLPVEPHSQICYRMYHHKLHGLHPTDPVRPINQYTIGVLNRYTLNAASRLYIEPVFYETPYTE